MNLKFILASVAAATLVCYGYAEYLNVRPHIRAGNDPVIVFDQSVKVTGYRTISTIKQLGDLLQNKPGGYVSNDLLPPWVFIDDIANFEYGVLDVVRKSLYISRDKFTRNNTGSQEDKDIVEAFTRYSIDSESWLFPSAESEYKDGSNSIQRYIVRLTDDNNNDGNFYTRATDLADFAESMNSILGAHAQKLGNSVAREVPSDGNLLYDYSGSKKETSAFTKTPYTQLDDVFWEAQGSVWAVLELLKAIRVDYKTVLENKSALTLVDKTIRELENSQQEFASPFVLNGSGYGITANHSLVLKSYVSNSSQFLSDLAYLLRNG